MARFDSATRSGLARSGLTLMLGLAMVTGCTTSDATSKAGPATAPTDECDCCAVPTTKPAAAADAKPAAGEKPATKPAEAAQWKDLYDGKSLKNWKIADYAGHGDVGVEDGLIILPAGEGLTGVTWTGEELPKTNYEVEVVAKKINGVDFFSAITFPVADSHATFVPGGWGGAVVGISSIDSQDASDNETTVYEKFDKGQFYKLRVRVEPKKIMAWIDDKEVVNVDIEGKKISVRGDIGESKPLGIASWTTTGAIKSVKFRELKK